MTKVEIEMDSFIKSRDWGDSAVSAIRLDQEAGMLALAIDDVSEYILQAMGNYKMKNKYLTRLVFFLFKDVSGFEWLDRPVAFEGFENQRDHGVLGKAINIWNLLCDKETDHFNITLDFWTRGGFITFKCMSCIIYEQEIYSQRIGDHFELFDAMEGGNPIDQEALLKDFIEHPEKF
jgi:hypothetical protein